MKRIWCPVSGRPITDEDQVAAFYCMHLKISDLTLKPAEHLRERHLELVCYNMHR